MPRARTIWLAAVAGFWLLLGACHKRRTPPPAESATHPAWSQAADPDSSVSDAEPPLPAPIAQALQEVRDQKIEIGVPQPAPQRLAFGRQRLAQAAEERVIFRDTKSGEVVAEAAIGAVRAVTQGADGSLFGLGLKGGTRLDPRASKKLATFAHIAFFPGSALFADLEDPSHLYVYDAIAEQLYHYAVDVEAGPVLPIEARLPFPGCTGVIGLLRDGAFVCRTSGGIERDAPRGRKAQFRLPPNVAPPVRLLPAKRLDELFSVAQSGEVVRLRLQSPLLELARFQLPAPPFGAAASAEALAFVLVTPPSPGSRRRWSLWVCDLDGHERFRTELPARDAPPGDDWLKAVVADKNLAISEFEPLVAVGGAQSVSVWNYAERALVFVK